MELFEQEKALESFMQRREKMLKEEKRYSSLMLLPIAVIIASIMVICYNFLVGTQLSKDFAGETESRTQAAGWSVGDNEFAVGVDDDKLMDMNLASVEDFKVVPGIGDAKARRIVLLREKMGGFRTVEDVLNTKGVGEELLKEIKRYFVVR